MIKLKYLIVFGGALALPVALPAADIKGLTAGTLQTASMTIKKGETTLTISGTMNAADFSYLQDNFNNLQRLDLSEVTIVGYSGPRLPYTGLTTSAAGTLPSYSLTGLTTLKEVSLPSNLTAIGKGALSGTGITSITIPSGVKEIGAYAFLRCGNLETVNIPAGVTGIGERAFAYCDNLTSVNIEDNSRLTVIPEGLFEASGLKSLRLKSLAECTEIGPWALAECNGLMTLVLPDATRNIGEAALLGDRAIQTLSLPANLDYLGDHAMANMTELSTLNVKDLANIPDLGESVWRNVNQRDVLLITPDELTSEFEEAAQWKDFRIVSESNYESSTENVISSANNLKLKIHREGDRLMAESDMALGRVSIYDVSGHLVAGANTPHHNIMFNTSGWSNGIYLIVCEAGVAKVRI